VNIKFNVFYSTFTNVFILVAFLRFLTFFFHFNLKVFFTSMVSFPSLRSHPMTVTIATFVQCPRSDCCDFWTLK